jgi:hypothetical protein
MRDARFPTDLIVSVDDFLGSGCDEALATTTSEGYAAKCSALSSAAAKAIEDGRTSHGKVLWLLADACSMLLTPASVNQPYKPLTQWGDKRSAMPDDFSEADVALFADVVEATSDRWLKARLADMVWLRKPKRELKFALAAIDAYRSIPLDETTWAMDGRECWSRAVALAHMIGDGGGTRINELEHALLEALLSATKNDGFFCLGLADVLDTFRLARDQPAKVANKLRTLATELDTHGERHRAREYFRVAARWFTLARDGAKSAEMKVGEAEGWVKEAVACISSDSPSRMLAATSYENAIQVYRTIPRTERVSYRVDDRISELRTTLNETGQEALSEMKRVTSPGFDISKLVDNSRDAVRGKTPFEALKAFCGLHSGVDATEARENTMRRLRHSPLSALSESTLMSGDGRVIAKRPGMSFSTTLTASDELAIRSEMVRDHDILVRLVVQGQLWPALEVLWLEHRLLEGDFVELARQSPIVPNDRARLFGKALFDGYDRDFVSAIHILVPQMEHLVRFHLKQSGVKTTTLDSNGIENEVGLSALIDYPEAEKVFGQNLCFEIRALFCDPFGPNLRNELAHGLLDDEASQSIYSVYAWWFGLRLVFTAFWSARRTDLAGKEEDSA